METREEVIETISAFLQYYREQATYLERTSHWVARVGLESIKKAIFDDQVERAALVERMEIALSRHQDPWAAIVENEERQIQLFEKKKNCC